MPSSEVCGLLLFSRSMRCLTRLKTIGAQGAAAKNGEPLFCGKDVCEALGYKRAMMLSDNTLTLVILQNAVLLEMLRIDMVRVLKLRWFRCSSSMRAVSIPASSVRSSKARSDSRLSHPFGQYRQGHAGLHPARRKSKGGNGGELPHLDASLHAEAKGSEEKIKGS